MRPQQIRRVPSPRSDRVFDCCAMRVSARMLMRFGAVLLLVASVLALDGAAAPSAFAVEPSGPPEVEGWLRLPQRGAMMIYRCQSGACGGAGALISIYRHREVLADVTAEVFMHLQEVNNAEDIVRNPGMTSVVSLRTASSHDGIPVFTAWQDRVMPNGDALFVLNSLIPGPSATVTVVALAGTRAQVAANFEAFLPQLPKLAR